MSERHFYNVFWNLVDKGILYFDEETGIVKIKGNTIEECKKENGGIGYTYIPEFCSTEEFSKIAKEKGIEKWEPRGGFLEFFGLQNKNESTFVGGCGFFTTGHHALELHILPARKVD